MINVFKLDDTWCFEADGHVKRGFATKDEAQMLAEKYITDKRKAEAKAKREAKKKESESESDKE